MLFEKTPINKFLFSLIGSWKLCERIRTKWSWVLVFGMRWWKTWLSMIKICLNKLSPACSHRVMKGSHDCEQYPKRLLFLMKAWIMFIVWHVVSMPAFLWLWANPHQAWDAYMSLLRILELKTYCSSSTSMLRALSRLSAYKELPHEDSKWSICPSIS